jgi:hypothetical protein
MKYMYVYLPTAALDSPFCAMSIDPRLLHVVESGPNKRIAKLEMHELD